MGKRVSQRRVLSWNVNGLRAVAKNGFFEWLAEESPDVLCLQETKCMIDDLDFTQRLPNGYTSYFHSAEKKGYSGVAIYSKEEPLRVTEGIGHKHVDIEGRVLTAEFEKFTVVNAYFPNSQRDHARLEYKLAFCDLIHEYLEKLRKKAHKEGRGVILVGDYNIAHEAIDLRNPTSNKDNAGFLPEERAWMTKFLGSGWIDTFRHFIKDPGHYSWWSYRPGVREKNVGWRIDYVCVNREFLPSVSRAYILPEIKGSDHCPVGIDFDIA